MSKKDLSHREVVLTEAIDKRVVVNGKMVHREPQSAIRAKVAERDDWNCALAAASGTELKLIRVTHRLYPFHLIQEVHNDFILDFENGDRMFCPGKIHLEKRIEYVGPRYSELIYYNIFPVKEMFRKRRIADGQPVYDIYEYLHCIKNAIPKGTFKEAHLKMAESLIRQQAVVV